MVSKVTFKKKTIPVAYTLALSASVSLAQDVELNSSDGSLNIRGELIEFADEQYTVETSIGRMTVESDLVVCSGEACPAISPPTSEFSVVGLGTLAGVIMPEFLPAYADSIDAQISDTTDGNYVLSNAEDEEVATISLADTLSLNSLPDLLSSQTAITLSSIPLLADEVSELNPEQPPGQADNNHVIGLNAITIVTSQDNPVSAMSIDDVARVFSGEYSNWSELGGSDAPIVLYGSNPDSELAKTFETLIASTQNGEKPEISDDIFFFENIAERVAQNPDGIGYTYFPDSQPAKLLDIQGLCGMATPANSFTIKAGEYPLTQRIYAYRLAQVNAEQADALLSFIQSEAGQDIVSAHGLVNQLDTANSIKNQGMRFVNAIAVNTSDAESDLLKEMVTQIIGNERLSTTFRFETDTDTLDQRAQADIVRLVEKLQSPLYDDSTVHLMGFTDTAGDFESNREVSLQRANQVRDALIEIDTALADRISILPAGFGEIAPVACNDTAQGRLINQRVEVWIGGGG